VRDLPRRALRAYTTWLHTRWPAGTVERLPEVGAADGRTNVPGLHVVGDLTGIPLLKLSADSGAAAVQAIAADPSFARERERAEPDVRDVVIVGAGVSGMAAALEARQAGLSFEVLEAKRRFQTIADFPRHKPIYAYPTAMRPRGRLQPGAAVKEALLAELEEQTRTIDVRDAHAESVRRRGGRLEVALSGGGVVRARRVVVGIGRSGSFRSLGVPGESLDKVHNRLHDPRDFDGRRVLVVGGGDSALEVAVALAQCGAEVTLCHRGRELARPKPDNLERLRALIADPGADVAVERPSSERVGTAAGPFLEDARRPGRVTLELGARLVEIREDLVLLRRADGQTRELPNDFVFSMIGREVPLDFFRRSGVRIAGEWSRASLAGLAGLLLFCLWLYHWKSPYAIPFGWKLPAWLDPDPRRWLPRAGSDPTHLLATLRASASAPSFYYTLAYSAVVVAFGLRRIRRRRTPYVTAQTLTLMGIQVGLLFLLPEILLPWCGRSGAFDAGWGRTLADGLFPASAWSPHGREYWRAYGLVLAWPLFVWNWFTDEPLAWWLVIGSLQSFVLIPWMIRRWGKGAYCGWICSCGALAETLGDRHRHKMPHGPGWNRLNMAGQAILAAALGLLALRILGWSLGPGSWAARGFAAAHRGLPLLNYNWLVDLMLAGVLGYGLYFWFSGRVWCRFACPLAALMHVYARFSRFRILADKKKCISCNVCTSVCHQGIDVMNFANKGLPMADPECVRCSACVAACPTGVLEFGRLDRSGGVLRVDRLAASPVRMREG
jgi:thioredoxin reductase/ferredoxin